MNFHFTPEQLQIQDAIEKLCKPFDAEYWLKKDQLGDFPFDFHKALADAGWLGIAMPSENGGAGLGITEAALMMRVFLTTSTAFACCAEIAQFVAL